MQSSLNRSGGICHIPCRQNIFILAVLRQLGPIHHLEDMTRPTTSPTEVEAAKFTTARLDSCLSNVWCNIFYSKKEPRESCFWIFKTSSIHHTAPMVVSSLSLFYFCACRKIHIFCCISGILHAHLNMHVVSLWCFNFLAAVCFFFFWFFFWEELVQSGPVLCFFLWWCTNSL